MRFKFFLLIFILVFACKSNENQPEFEKKPLEPDPFKRAKESAEKGGGLFTLGRDNQNTTFSFATSNVLWRATLKSLDFLPLLNADYAGGVIIFDWYAKDLNSNEQIKITVRFLNNEVRADSIKVISHKRTCDENGKCNTILLSENFSSEIKDGIIVAARSMKILDQKKDNK